MHGRALLNKLASAKMCCQNSFVAEFMPTLLPLEEYQSREDTTSEEDNIVRRGRHNRQNSKPISWPLNKDILSRFKPLNKKSYSK